MYKLYFWAKRVIKNEKNSVILHRLAEKIIGYIEAYYNLFVKKMYIKHPSDKIGITVKKREQKIIVSLTSFPKRIDTLWITVETLLRQSMKPDEIILWLAEEQFNGIDSLPKALLEQQKRGLTIRFCDDLRSHKKYYYTMQEYPRDIVILVDDDMFYPKDTIKKLWKLHKKYPNDICSITTQIIDPSFDSKPSIWRNPLLNEKIEHSDKVQIFTGSGSLFVPDSLDQRVFDKELLLDLCPFADDLWITFMAYKNETRITSLNKWRAFPITIYGTSQDSLWFINAQDGKNDEQWENLKRYFPNEFTKQEKLSLIHI